MANLMARAIDGIIGLVFIAIFSTGAKEASMFMAKEAFQTHRKGTISLSELSRGLQGDKKYCEWYRSVYEEPCPPKRK